MGHALLRTVYILVTDKMLANSQEIYTLFPATQHFGTRWGRRSFTPAQAIIYFGAAFKVRHLTPFSPNYRPPATRRWQKRLFTNMTLRSESKRRWLYFTSNAKIPRKDIGPLFWYSAFWLRYFSLDYSFFISHILLYFRLICLILNAIELHLAGK